MAAGKEMWDIILVDEVKAEHRATFEEAKNYLTNMMRQQAVENEAKKILGGSANAPKPTAKRK
jgi:phage protein D